MKTKITQAIPDWMFVALKGWGWKGAFDSWEAAQLRSNGYNADNILLIIYYRKSWPPL